jgi:ribosomal protein S18 acetylase RimI-like enzyme
MADSVHMRIAGVDDVETLLDLMMISSWGGIRAAWERVRQPGESWRDRGLAELRDPFCEIGYTRFVLAEIRDRIAGMMLVNLLGDTSGLKPELEPPEQAGAVALIRLARQSVFVRELAVTEWARGRGVARSFLDLAEQLSASHHLGRVTLIVNDANGPAHGLYVKRGFHLIDTQPSIGHPRFPEGSMLLLMEKQITDR